MKTIILLASLFLTLQAYSAQGISVEVSTMTPTLDDSFLMQINVESDEDEAPSITFDPEGVEIIGQNDQGVTQRSTYINGKLTTTREFVVLYELKPVRAGRITIRNIEARLGGKTLRHHPVSLNVEKEKKALASHFILAYPSKTEVFKGEAILLRYYLYYKTPTMGPEIREFPKLKDFTKRYLQDNPVVERVNYEGEIFDRVVLYTCVIFPDKLGTLKIDPLRVTVKYPIADNRDPFGGFNAKVGSKSIASPVVDVIVKALPAENVPPHFTGLIGKHSFDLSLNKTKFLVNEPIEIKLKVSGEGNLEALDPPVLLNNPAIESFEANSDLEISSNSAQASKVFNYTYLPRGKTDLADSDIPLAYFDPYTQTYQTIHLKLPAISIAGESFTPSVENAQAPQADEKVAPTIVLEKKHQQIYGPILMSNIFDRWGIIKIINLCLIVIVLGFAIKNLSGNISFSRSDGVIGMINHLSKSGLSYAKVYEILDLLDHKSIGVTQKISESSLSSGAKDYFRSVLNETEQISYGEKAGNVKFNSTHFKELYKLLTDKSQVKENENNKLPWGDTSA